MIWQSVGSYGVFLLCCMFLISGYKVREKIVPIRLDVNP